MNNKGARLKKQAFTQMNIKSLIQLKKPATGLPYNSNN